MKESQIQEGFRAWLNDTGKRVGVFYVNPSFTKRSTIRADWPDFTLFKLGRSLLIESKTAKGPLSDGQKALHTELRQAGIAVEVCRSVEEHVQKVLAWLETIPAVEWRALLENAPAGNLATNSVQIFGLPLVVSDAVPTDTVIIDPGNGKPPTVAKLFGSNERIGDWQGKRWLIRTDDKGQEMMIRVATPKDVARVTIAAAKL